jgi:trehalose 6-phosphate synthase
MRLSLRFIVPLPVVLAAFAYAVLPIVDDLTVRWFRRDLDIRASLIANTVQEPLQNLTRSGDHAKAQQVLTRIAQDEKVFDVGGHDPWLRWTWPSSAMAPSAR